MHSHSPLLPEALRLLVAFPHVLFVLTKYQTNETSNKHCKPLQKRSSPSDLYFTNNQLKPVKGNIFYVNPINQSIKDGQYCRMLRYA